MPSPFENFRVLDNTSRIDWPVVTVIGDHDVVAADHYLTPEALRLRRHLNHLPATEVGPDSLEPRGLWVSGQDAASIRNYLAEEPSPFVVTLKPHRLLHPGQAVLHTSYQLEEDEVEIIGEIPGVENIRPVTAATAPNRGWMVGRPSRLFIVTLVPGCSVTDAYNAFTARLGAAE